MLDFPTGLCQYHPLTSPLISLLVQPSPLEYLSLCRHGHCPLLPGFTATSKVTSTLSNSQCPKVPFTFRYVLTMTFLRLELGSDYLRKHRSTILSLNVHLWRDRSAHLPLLGPFIPSSPLRPPGFPLTSPNSATDSICLHTDSTTLMLELF